MNTLDADAPVREVPAAELLSAPLVLGNGTVIKNRIMKSAMSEVLASVSHAPTEGLATLYERWARGGLGLAITGNVMIDRRRLGEPRNVVVEDERDLGALEAWAAAGTVDGTHLWMQINHPGKQSPSFLSAETVAPSAVPFGGGLDLAFATPRALREDEITDIIERFGRTAGIAKKAGFTGVQIHGAHGYLVSQFLSPHHNRRTDRWGGSLENRARFVQQVYRSMRDQVGPDFSIAIKINSADFMSGGFSEDESVQVIESLANAGIDLVEISGGTYEAPAMTGARRQSTVEREAYFLSFAERLRQRVDVPLAVTGGFRSAAGMGAALRSGALDIVGMARGLALEPDFPSQVLSGDDAVSRVRPLTTGVRAMDKFSMLEVTYYENQIARMAEGKEPLVDMHTWRSVFTSMTKNGIQVFQKRRATG